MKGQKLKEKDLENKLHEFIKINYPDTMGGWWEETITHLERFTESIDINDKSILWQHGTLPPMYKYGNSELSINI